MTSVRNISDGPRGIYTFTGNLDKDERPIPGELVMIDPGKCVNVALMPGEGPGEWFEFDGAPAPGADTFDPEAFIDRNLSDISDEELAALTGDQREAVYLAEIDREKPRKGLTDKLDAMKGE
jgi:hypothetical protein